MSTMASQITSITIVYSAVYSGTDQRKHQSSASLAFVRGIHRGPVNSPHKWPVMRKMFPFDDVIMVFLRWGVQRSRLVSSTWNNSLIIGIYPASGTQRHVIMSPPSKHNMYCWKHIDGFAHDCTKPLLTHWSYCGLAQSYIYVASKKTVLLQSLWSISSISKLKYTAGGLIQ